MRQSLATATYLAAFLAAALHSAAEPQPIEARDDYTSVCKEISKAVSSASGVHWPGKLVRSILGNHSRTDGTLHCRA